MHTLPLFYVCSALESAQIVTLTFYSAAVLFHVSLSTPRIISCFTKKEKEIKSLFCNKYMKLLKGFPLDARSPKLRLNHKLDGSLRWLLRILCFGQQCDGETNCIIPFRMKMELESVVLIFRYFRLPPHCRLVFRSSSFLSFVTQCVLVFPYRRFGAAYQSHLFGLFDP